MALTVIYTIINNGLTFDRLTAIARWTERLVRLPPTTFTNKSLRYTYAAGAKAKKLLAMDGTLRMQTLCVSVHKLFAPILMNPGFEFVQDLGGNSGGFVGTLTRQYDGLHHPTKHLLLAITLFDSWDAFIDTHDTVARTLDAGRDDLLIAMRQEPREQLKALIEDGISVNAAAKALEISVTQAIGYLNSQGIGYCRRPRIIGTETEQKLIERLALGEPSPVISQALGIRTAFVKDYLAKRPELKAKWVEAHFKQQQDEHRAQLLAVLESNQDLPIKQIRLLPRNGFQWLYNNDRDWLREVLPALWRR